MTTQLTTQLTKSVKRNAYIGSNREWLYEGFWSAQYDEMAAERAERGDFPGSDEAATIATALRQLGT